MLKNYLKKVIALGIIATSVLALNPIGASAEWKQDSKGWWYSEGRSYSQNKWKQINGNWYYFDYYGYMEHDTIIGGCYLNSSGTWSNGTKEIQKYLKEIKSNTLVYDCVIEDIDNDGISEAIVVNGSCMNDTVVTILDYNNGQVQKHTISCDHACILGHNNGTKEIAIESISWTGYLYGNSYKLEDNKYEKTSSWSAQPLEDGYEYKINSIKVSKQQLDSFRNNFKK